MGFDEWAEEVVESVRVTPALMDEAGVSPRVYLALALGFHGSLLLVAFGAGAGAMWLAVWWLG